MGVGVGVLGGVEHPGTMTDTQPDRQTDTRKEGGYIPTCLVTDDS